MAKLDQCLSVSLIIDGKTTACLKWITPKPPALEKYERAQESQRIKDNGHMAHGMLNVPLEENHELEGERENEGKHQIHLGERRHHMFTLTMESWAPPSLSHTMRTQMNHA